MVAGCFFFLPNFAWKESTCFLTFQPPAWKLFLHPFQVDTVVLWGGNRDISLEGFLQARSSSGMNLALGRDACQQGYTHNSRSLLTGTLPFARNAATLERSSSLTLVGTTRTAGYVSQSSYVLLILDIFQLSLGKPCKGGMQLLWF